MPSVTLLVRRDDTQEVVAQFLIDERRVEAINHEIFGGILGLIAHHLTAVTDMVIAQAESVDAPKYTENKTIRDIKSRRDVELMGVEFKQPRIEGIARYQPGGEAIDKIVDALLVDGQDTYDPTSQESVAFERARIVAHYEPMIEACRDLLTPRALEVVTL